MRRKRAFLVINPRAGQDMTRLPDVIAVLAAAGWRTDNAIVEYSGHSIKLAKKAAEEGYDLIIAHGGDGTINDVVNGVMKCKGHQSVIGVLPGGTANQWATEIGMPLDPIKAALTLIESDPRAVDLGCIELQGFMLPAPHQGDNREQQSTKSKKNQRHTLSKSCHYFLLTAGFGIDASIIHDTSKMLKAHLGRVAFDVAALKALPELHSFPATLNASENEHTTKSLWQGEALQIILGNTRRYANAVEFTPNAFMDDGALDACVITKGNPLSTIEQVTSLLTRHKPDNATADYFHEPHFSLTVPASLLLQLDGSTIKLTDTLRKSDRETLRTMTDVDQLQATYLFDTVPHVLQMAIPRAYNNTLFAGAPKKGEEQRPASSLEKPEANEQNMTATNGQQSQYTERADENAQVVVQQETQANGKNGANGHRVTVIGVALHSEKKQVYVIAGNTNKERTGEIKPAAISINAKTTTIDEIDENASPSIIQQLQEGSVIVVEGKESERGVIQATHVTL